VAITSTGIIMIDVV